MHHTSPDFWRSSGPHEILGLDGIRANLVIGCLLSSRLLDLWSRRLDFQFAGS